MTGLREIRARLFDADFVWLQPRRCLLFPLPQGGGYFLFLSRSRKKRRYSLVSFLFPVLIIFHVSFCSSINFLAYLCCPPAPFFFPAETALYAIFYEGTISVSLFLSAGWNMTKVFPPFPYVSLLHPCRSSSSTTARSTPDSEGSSSRYPGRSKLQSTILVHGTKRFAESDKRPANNTGRKSCPSEYIDALDGVGRESGWKWIDQRRSFSEKRSLDSRFAFQLPLAYTVSLFSRTRLIHLRSIVSITRSFFESTSLFGPESRHDALITPLLSAKQARGKGTRADRGRKPVLIGRKETDQGERPRATQMENN